MPESWLRRHSSKAVELTTVQWMVMCDEHNTMPLLSSRASIVHRSKHIPLTASELSPSPTLYLLIFYLYLILILIPLIYLIFDLYLYLLSNEHTNTSYVPVSVES